MNIPLVANLGSRGAQSLSHYVRRGPAPGLTGASEPVSRGWSAPPRVRLMADAFAPLTAAELAYYDINAPLLGFMGAAFALIFSNLGAAYGTGKSGMGISALGVGKPELVMKSIVPVRAYKH